MNRPDPAPPPLTPAYVRLEQLRRRLLVAVDELRTLLINGDDLHRPAGIALGEAVAGITELAESYRDARGDAEAQPGGLTAGLQRRRYVNASDTILLVLPDTQRCRRAHHGVVAATTTYRVQPHAPRWLSDLDGDRVRLPLRMGAAPATDRLRRRRHA
jgi:hypothetical protein